MTISLLGAFLVLLAVRPSIVAWVNCMLGTYCKGAVGTKRAIQFWRERERRKLVFSHLPCPTLSLQFFFTLNGLERCEKILLYLDIKKLAFRAEKMSCNCSQRRVREGYICNETTNTDWSSRLSQLFRNGVALARVEENIPAMWERRKNKIKLCRLKSPCWWSEGALSFVL